MSDAIDYYFTAPSPFAYLGHKTLISVAEKHGKKINFKPFNIMGVWENSGAEPPMKRPPVRQRYRLLDIKRAGVMRDTCINAEPAFFPTNPTPADLVICALGVAGENQAEFSFAIGQAIWVNEKDISDDATLLEVLSECGHDAQKILELSKTDETATLRNKNTQEAIAADAVGAPAYVYQDEVFWGQDRLEYLEQMITSGRPAFTA